MVLCFNVHTCLQSALWRTWRQEPLHPHVCGIYIYIYIYIYIFEGAVCRTVVAIDFYKGPSEKYESVEARYPGILFSGLRSAITTSRKNGKTKKPFFLSSGSVFSSVY